MRLAGKAAEAARKVALRKDRFTGAGARTTCAYRSGATFDATPGRAVGIAGRVAIVQSAARHCVGVFVISDDAPWSYGPPPHFIRVCRGNVGLDIHLCMLTTLPMARFNAL